MLEKQRGALRWAGTTKRTGKRRGRRSIHGQTYHEQPKATANKPLSPELRRECREVAVWSAQRNLWTCKEELEYAKLPEDREKALKAIKTWGEILDKAQKELEKL